MLSITGLSYSYGPPGTGTVFHNLSLTAGRGEFVAIVGASGCGKSTLFKIIAGLLEHGGGEISLYGEPAGAAAERLGRVAYMPQQDLLLPWRTVLDNCLLPWEIRRDGSKAQAVAQIRELLQRFGLSGTETAFPRQLSGGMRQRIALLRTFAAGRPLLLLDEPFGALDAITKRELHRWLLELWNGIDKTVLLITHDLEEALLLSDRIYIMAGGTLQELAVPLPRPRTPELSYVPEFAALRREMERCLYADHRMV
ncbi:ABC transporter ATP-binding protein ['Paenibacillus yunnanensis' Narsing Rao et al. 2020]|uniref:ABC transporter ATP-binding protein n=1 Tax=Paenibacillus tengchongensis TaxID=2608684 RepID=UPI00124CDB03|nr:ABC transporter ATP-binding protein [Paenibacillus tengchongensis]